MKYFGGVVRLMMESPIHREWTTGDIDRLIWPPILLKQCALILVGDEVKAFGSWALLTEEAEQGYVSGTRKLQPTDWRAGDRLWFVDALAPYGHADKLAKAMRNRLELCGLSGRTIRFRRNKGGHRHYSRVTV